jgi:predicted regulator of Ras-like GTPase activity (Roadblock/LC7/MglB family)
MIGMQNNILKNILDSVKGLKMVAVFDKDGFVVFKEGDEDIADEISAEFSSMLKYMKKISTNLNINDISSFIFEGDNRKLFFRKITEDYYVVVSMDVNALIGKLRYVLDVFNDQLLKEFI